MRIIVGPSNYTDGNWRSIRHKLGQEESFPQRLCSWRQWDVHISCTREKRAQWGRLFWWQGRKTHTLDDPRTPRHVLLTLGESWCYTGSYFGPLQSVRGGHCSRLITVSFHKLHTVSWCTFRLSQSSANLLARGRRAKILQCWFCFRLEFFSSCFVVIVKFASKLFLYCRVIPWVLLFYFFDSSCKKFELFSKEWKSPLCFFLYFSIDMTVLAPLWFVILCFSSSSWAASTLLTILLQHTLKRE